MQTRQDQVAHARTHTTVRRLGFLSFLRTGTLPVLLAGLLAPIDGRSEFSLVPQLPLPELVPLYTKALHFTNDVRLRVESPNVQYQVGDQVLLFDVNSECFIGIRRDEQLGVNELIAFPRLDETGEGTAWITNEKQLIFGSRTRSSEGVLVIRRGEILPVVQQASQTFTVLFRRFGREATITLPRNLGSCLVEPATPPIELIMAHEAADAAAQAAALEAAELARPAPLLSRPILPASIARANREATRPASNPAPAPAPAPAPIAVERPRNLLSLSANELPSGAVVRVSSPPQPLLVATPPVTPVAAPQPEAPPVTPPVPAQVAVSPPVAPPVATSSPVVVAQSSAPGHAAPTAMVAKAEAIVTNLAVATVASNRVPAVVLTPLPAAATPVVLAKAAPPAAPAPTSSTLPTFLSFNSWTFWVLLATVALEGVMIARLLLRKRAGAHADGSNQVFSFSSVGESVMDLASESFVTGTDGDLQGELEKFSMGHVVQFFHSSGESGALTISDSNGRVDKLIFDRGQIIDAVSGNRCGEAAVDVVLRRRQGSFKFTREDTSKRLRLITQDTMALLMDAARVIDEKGWSD